MSKEIELYGKYAAVSLVFSFYTLLEDMKDSRNDYIEISRPVVDEICDIIEHKEFDEERLDCLRDNMMKHVEVLMTYTDSFSAYEYVLNRVEYRYRDQEKADKLLKNDGNNEWLKKILFFIVADKTPTVVNDKVRMVMSQLPVRLTKQKFYEKIEGAMSLFIDGDYNALSDFLYRIRTSGMLANKDHQDLPYPEFDQWIERFSSTDMTKLTEKQFDEFADGIAECALEISNLTDVYYELQNVINYVYALAMSKSDECHEVLLQMVRLYREQGDLATIVPELEKLEGRIEDYMMKTSRIEAKMINDGESKEQIVKLANLMSDSLFIDLYDNKEPVVVTKKIVAKEAQSLFAEFDLLFKGTNVLVKRAIMAQSLFHCPLMFHSINEVEDEIKIALTTCTDRAERAAVYELLDGMMAD